VGQETAEQVHKKVSQARAKKVVEVIKKGVSPQLFILRKVMYVCIT
jgi:hypothetical protein